MAARAEQIKRSFDIDEVLSRVEAAVRAFRPAALFELASEGFSSAFELLVACLISIRTRDEATVTISRRLFAVARTPVQLAALPVEEIDRLIDPSTFHEAKAAQLHAIARLLVDRYGDKDGGTLPCDETVLLSFHGVGPKCANLVLGIACGQPRIGVDIHVHRVTNRWGYVCTSSPDRTMTALETRLPVRWWVDINRVLVPFGKHICTGQSPKCSTCPVLEMCRQVGVESHR